VRLSPVNATTSQLRRKRRSWTCRSEGLRTADEFIREPHRFFSNICLPSIRKGCRVPVTASGRTLRTEHGGLRAGIVARVCSTLQGRPTGSAENVGGPTKRSRSGENQARATITTSQHVHGQWGRDVKVGRGGERSQVGESLPVLLGEASSRRPPGRGPAPPLGNERMLGLRITDGPGNGCLASTSPRTGSPMRSRASSWGCRSRWEPRWSSTWSATAPRRGPRVPVGPRTKSVLVVDTRPTPPPQAMGSRRRRDVGA
jgi:hypothetical protein